MNKEEFLTIIKELENAQEKLTKKYKINFVFLSDVGISSKINIRQQLDYMYAQLAYTYAMMMQAQVIDETTKKKVNMSWVIKNINSSIDHIKTKLEEERKKGFFKNLSEEYVVTPYLKESIDILPKMEQNNE
jgi:hypothetical protein